MRRKRKRLTPTQRYEVYNKTFGHCAYCGVSLRLDEMQVDHIVALARGGEDNLSNMLPACRSCNYYKDTKTIEAFRRELSKIPSRLQRDNFTYRLASNFGLIVAHREKVVFYFETQKKKAP